MKSKILQAFSAALLGARASRGFLQHSSKSRLETPNGSASRRRCILANSNEEQVPVTPCTRICRYNSNVFDGQVCIGCFRETFEIGAWQGMSPDEKYYALLDAIDRVEEVVAAGTIDDVSTTGTSQEELLRQANYWRTVAASTS